MQLRTKRGALTTYIGKKLSCTGWKLTTSTCGAHKPLPILEKVDDDPLSLSPGWKYTRGSIQRLLSRGRRVRRFDRERAEVIGLEDHRSYDLAPKP